MICEPGERVTNTFHAFDNELCRCNWYSSPIKFQRFYLIFLLDTQLPVDTHSYGNIQCTRETFKKVKQLPNGNLIYF